MAKSFPNNISSRKSESNMTESFPINVSSRKSEVFRSDRNMEESFSINISSRMSEVFKSDGSCSLDSSRSASIFASLAAEANQICKSGRDGYAASSMCPSAFTVSSATASPLPSFSSPSVYGPAPVLGLRLSQGSNSLLSPAQHPWMASRSSSALLRDSTPSEVGHEELEEYSLGHGSPWLRY